MKFRILTYNLNLGKAWPHIGEVIKKSQPDIIALQEINTTESELQKLNKYGYELADYSNSFLKFNNIFGVATFFKSQLFQFSKANSIDLPMGLYEFIQFFVMGGRRHRTVLKTELIIQKRKLVIYNVHLSPYTTNSLRIKQLKETLKSLDIFNNPTIILGDFNYPYGRKTLEQIFGECELDEATNNIYHTFKSSIRLLPMKFKLDYVLYKNITHISTRKLEVKFSDHHPIIVEFEL